MSIVDKTLQRLDSAKQLAPGAPDASDASDATAPLHSIQQDLLYVTGVRKRRKPWALWLALLLLAVMGLVYGWALQFGPGAAPVPPQGQVIAPAQPPVEVVGQVVVPEPLPVAAAPAAPDALPEPPQQPPPQPPPQVALPSAAQQPEWMQRGWAVVRAEGLMQALPIWERGLQTLPDQQLLIVGDAFLDRHGMNAALARRDPSWAVFAVREAGVAQQGRAGQYRVVVLVPPNPPPDLLEAVAAQFGRADRLRAAALKRRTLGTEPPVQVATATAQSAAARAPAALAQAQQPQVQATPVVPVRPSLADTPAPVQPQRLQLPGPLPRVAAANGPDGQASPASAAPAPAAPVLAPLASDPATAAPQAAQRLGRRDWENRANHARELLRQGAFAQVAQHAEAMTRDFPDRWEPWFWLGTAALSGGQLTQAEQALDRALELNQGVAQVWIQRGIVAQERGNHAAAVRFLNEAASLAPRVPEAHLNLGFSLDAQGRSSEAERSFRTFLQLTQGNANYDLQRQHIQDWLARR